MVSLNLSRIPASFSYGIFDSYVTLVHRKGAKGSLYCRTHVLADPTSFEEPLLDTSLTVLVDEKSQTVSVLQEGVGLEQDVMKECVEGARRRRGEVKI